ncbi:MAG: electron transfer flavoprotein subunit beta/FixA family protein, partial [Alphaproteobacteria bacterium]
AKKTVTNWKVGDLGLDPGSVGKAGSRLKLERLFIPEKGGKVELMEGDTPQEQVAALVARLRADKIL